MGFSLWHLIIIAIIVLLLFGPNRLPTLGKSLGEAIRGFKKGIEGDEIDVTNATRREQIRPADSQTNTAKTEQTSKEEKKDNA